MMRIFRTVLDIIYPPRCAVCGGLVEYGRNMPLCSRCDKNLSDKTDIFMGQDGLSVFEYKDDIRAAIHSLKYFGAKELGEVFAHFMYEAVTKSGYDLDFDIILPVPISRERLKERGYNQTELIAKGLSRLMGIPVGEGLLRIRHTVPQSELTEEERAKNLKNAFGTERDFHGEKILLIDDIYTTGSTVKECRNALYRAGAERVGFCTTAFTRLRK